MACCEDETNCPMHATEQQGQRTRTRASQVDADNCCAASERGTSTPSASAYTPNVTLAVLTSLSPAVGPDVPVFRENPNARISVDVSPVPKHLLLSVFLI